MLTAAGRMSSDWFCLLETARHIRCDSGNPSQVNEVFVTAQNIRDSEMMLVESGWNWYVAQYVVEIRVVGFPTQTVRLVAMIDTYLLFATSKEEAYAKAIALGERISNSYHNANGDLITITCKGLHDLDNLQVETIQDEQQLATFRINNVTNKQIEALITPREHLSLFETDFMSNPNNNPDLCDA